MKIVSLIDAPSVIERILRHLKLWGLGQLLIWGDMLARREHNDPRQDLFGSSVTLPLPGPGCGRNHWDSEDPVVVNRVVLRSP